MEAQSVTPSARCVEPVSWQYRGTVAQGRLRERGRVAMWQAYPRVCPPCTDDVVPVGKMAGQFCAQVVMAGFELCYPALRPLQPWRQRGGGQLTGDVPAEVVHQASGPGPSRAITGSGARTHPMRGPARLRSWTASPTEITVSA